MTIICFKWDQPEYKIRYTAEHVNIWADMIRRNTSEDHRLLCITDDPEGIEIETYPLWETDIRVGYENEDRPQCHRRLKLFDSGMKSVTGDRFAAIDLDVVIVDTIDHILGRPEDFVIKNNKSGMAEYDGSFWMMDAGARPEVWHLLTKEKAQVASDQFYGSDQAWLSWILNKEEATVGIDDGIYSYLHIQDLDRPPVNASMIFFHGKVKPWSRKADNRWIRANYRRNS